MKSAYELAMERLEAKSPTKKLTEAQRAEIAEIDSLYQSKIAERRVFLEGEIAKNANNPFEQDALHKQLASDIRRLEDESEAKKERVRASG